MKLQNKKGFTLIELLVSVSIFVIVVFIAIGALLNISYVNKRSQTLLVALENLDFALENMSRTVRDGSFYTCDINAFDNTPNPQDSGMDCPNGKGLHFVDASNRKVLYRLKFDDWDGDGVQTGAVTRTRITPPPSSMQEDEIPITSSEIDVRTMNFIVTGAQFEQSGDDKHMQPRVMLFISGITNLKGVKPEDQAEFDIQTTMSQRKNNVVETSIWEGL